MAVPPQVQAQLDAAEKMLAAANNPTPATPPEEAPPSTPPEPIATAPQAQPEPPIPAPTAPPKQDEETWEARYKALKGMYNKQVPELQQQVQALTNKLETAIQKMGEQSQVTQPQEPPAPTADPQDVDAFGEDLVNMVKRTAERMFGGAAKAMQTSLTQLSERMAQLEQRLEGTSQTVATTAEQAFVRRLTELVPNWEQVNEDERFKAWCLDTDPVYGIPRQRALSVAESNLNADHAAAVFKAYLGQTTTPPTKQTPPVDSQVSPRAVASAPPPAPSAKPVLTTTQVDLFYRDVAQGKYRGREADQQRIEQVINEALAEGRIR